MNRLKRIPVLIFVLLTCVGCDQTTKMVAKEHLASSEPLSYMNNLFRLEYAENPGAFLSLGAFLPDTIRFWLFTVFVGILLSGMLLFVLFSTKLPPILAFAITLMVGGGVGNLIDRFIHGGVVIDFMNMGIGNLRTGIFNFADVAIMMGITLVLIFQSHLWE